MKTLLLATLGCGLLFSPIAASAATKNDAEAQYELGVQYSTESYAEAIKWYRKAAEQGLAKAQAALGVCYAEGEGVPRDFDHAVAWFRKAAEQGDAKGQYGLGVSFYKGQGVPQNHAEAIKWYRKAAEQGYAPAQRHLGLEVRAKSDPPDITTLDGRTYKSVRVLAVKPDGIEVEFKPEGRGIGVATIRFANLPRNLQQKLQPEVEKAASKAKRQAENALAVQERAVQERAEIVKRPGQKRSPQPRADQKHGATGTGFFITDDGYLITCAHVVQGSSSFRVRTASGLISANLIKEDRVIDIAVLKVSGKFHEIPVSSAGSGVRLGDAVFTVGFPNPDLQGVEPKLTRGEISSMAGIHDNPRYFQVSVPVQPGNSGGALMDECGNAVGVVTARLDDAATYEISGALPQNVNYAVKGNAVRGFLDKVPELSSKLKTPRTGRDREAATIAAERAAVLVIAE